MSVFHCKQFSIEQSDQVLKVSTEALLLGALAVNQAQAAAQVLDIGCGSGLLSLMLAQASKAHITALDIDAQACQLAERNIGRSFFSQQITLHLADINTFYPPQAYDFILSNPPFYQKHLKSSLQAKNTAKHDSHLTLAELSLAVDRLLAPGGSFMVLLPPQAMEQLKSAMQALNYQISTAYTIRHTENTKILRIIATFDKSNLGYRAHQICIKDKFEKYSEQFIKILHPYYIIF